jgi:hypothetical protein
MQKWGEDIFFSLQSQVLQVSSSHITTRSVAFSGRKTRSNIAIRKVGAVDEMISYFPNMWFTLQIPRFIWGW